MGAEGHCGYKDTGSVSRVDRGGWRGEVKLAKVG